MGRGGDSSHQGRSNSGGLGGFLRGIPTWQIVTVIGVTLTLGGIGYAVRSREDKAGVIQMVQKYDQEFWSEKIEECKGEIAAAMKKAADMEKSAAEQVAKAEEIMATEDSRKAAHEKELNNHRGNFDAQMAKLDAQHKKEFDAQKDKYERLIQERAGEVEELKSKLDEAHRQLSLQSKTLVSTVADTISAELQTIQKKSDSKLQMEADKCEALQARLLQVEPKMEKAASEMANCTKEFTLLQEAYDTQSRECKALRDSFHANAKILNQTLTEAEDLAHNVNFAPPPPPAEKPDLEALSKDLPEGWQALWDAKRGKVYYGNFATKQTQWDKPTRRRALRRLAAHEAN